MYIKVRVFADSSREVFNKISEIEYEISIKEKAERNMANRRVVEILKDKLVLKRIKLVTGHHSPSKIFDIEK